MGAVLLSPVYILLHLYLAARLLHWFSLIGGVFASAGFTVVFLTVFLLIAVTPLPGAYARGRLKRAAKQISNYWLGILLYLLLSLIASELLWRVFCLFTGRPLFSRIADSVYLPGGAAVLTATAFISLYGILHARRIRKTAYSVTIHKSCGLASPSLKIALVADLHLGCSVSLRQLQNIAAMVQDMNPDLILFAGDLFDNEFEAIRHPEECAEILASMKSTYGSFACWGNHDVEERILAGFTFHSKEKKEFGSLQMNHFLEASGIRLLADETLLIDDAFYLAGRSDASSVTKARKTGAAEKRAAAPLPDSGRKTPAELTTGLAPDKPLLVIDHQPSQLRELAAAGADLVLSGHTHDGQLFPANLLTRIGWMNSYGQLCIGDTTSIVTSGAGIWGPAMRVGTDSEVVEIQVRFSGSPVQTNAFLTGSYS